MRCVCQVHAKLVGGHKGAVTALAALAAPQPGGADLLLSAGADGIIALWEPSAAPPRDVDREISPKVHAACLLSLRGCLSLPVSRHCSVPSSNRCKPWHARAGHVQGARGRGAGHAAIPGQQ